MNENKSSSKDQRQGPSWGIVIVIFFLLTFFLNLFMGRMNQTKQLQISYDQFSYSSYGEQNKIFRQSK